MKIYNEDKSKELTADEVDYDEGYLINDTITIRHPAVEEVREQGHYITIAEYPNGGKDVEWVVDLPGIESCEAYDEAETIKVYKLYTVAERNENKLQQLRQKRALECFPVINRGQLWHNRLTDAQKAELDAWYNAWLDVTASFRVPDRPEWLS